MTPNEALFAFVNSSNYGGTSFNIPDQWKLVLEGYQPHIDKLPQDVEAISELEIDANQLFLKKGSVKTSPHGSHPISYPFVYENRAEWFGEYNTLRGEISEWLENQEVQMSVEWLDSYLTDNAAYLPEMVLENLKILRNKLLPLYDGNVKTIDSLFAVANISTSVEDTRFFWAKRVNDSIRLITEYINTSSFDDIEVALNCIKGLKGFQRILPQLPHADVNGGLPVPIETKSVSLGERNLVESFQNRGSDIEHIRTIFSNNENRVIVITGAIGIGKTDFLNLVFRKSFSDWKVVKISVPRDARMPRIIVDIGHHYGIRYDIDSLASCTHNVFRQKVRKIVDQIYTLQKRALIIDDIHEILKNRKITDKIVFVYNENFDAGMFGSIQAGILECGNCDWAIMHQVDQPVLPQKFYSAFINEIDTKHNWIQPSYNNRYGHPILINKSLFGLILREKTESNLKIVSRNKMFIKKVWECNYKEILQDIDTEKDYINLLKSNYK